MRGFNEKNTKVRVFYQAYQRCMEMGSELGPWPLCDHYVFCAKNDISWAITFCYWSKRCDAIKGLIEEISNFTIDLGWQLQEIKVQGLKWMSLVDFSSGTLESILGAATEIAFPAIFSATPPIS